MMKMVTTILLLVFSIETFANTGSLQAFEKAIDDYSYFTNVEWDQKDKAALAEKSDELRESLASVLGEGSLSRTDLENFLKKKIVSKQALNAVLLKLRLANVNSPEAVSTILSQSSKDLYAQGANWNGDIDGIMFLGGLGVLAVSVGFVLYILTKAVVQGSCKEYSSTEKVQDCGYYSNCHTTNPDDGWSLGTQVCDTYSCKEYAACIRH